MLFKMVDHFLWTLRIKPDAAGNMSGSNQAAIETAQAALNNVTHVLIAVAYVSNSLAAVTHMASFSFNSSCNVPSLPSIVRSTNLS